MLQAISWWAAVEALGLITLPLSIKIFKSLPDKGYAFSKILGLLLFSYVIWISASAHILPAHRLTLIFFLLTFCGLFAAWLLGHPQAIQHDLKGRFSTVLAVEIIFTSAFALWAVVRSYAPAITATEKPMDFAFLNSILMSSYMPPPDPWLSGFSLNYYYFGHFIVATLTKLTGVPSSVGFNLAIALFFSLVSVGVFSLVYNLVARREGDRPHRKAIIFGLLGIMLFLLVSNLEGILEFFYARGMGSLEFWKWFDIKGLSQPNVSSRWYPTEHFFFWRATRVIDTVIDGRSLDYTITEFPFFSFLLADLHAHLLALPFVLMSLGFSMGILFTREPLGTDWLRQNAWSLVIMIIGLGSLGIIHSWDLPTYTVIFIAAIFLQSYLVPPPGRKWLPPVLISLLVFIGIFFYYLPYYGSFQRPVTGVLPWVGPGTRPIYWLILYGLFALIVIPAMFVEARSLRKKNSSASRVLGLVAPLILGPIVIWTLLMIAIGSPSPTSLAVAVSTRWRNLVPVLVFLLLMFWLVLAKSEKVRKISPWDLAGLYAAVLILVATLIIYVTELFYVRDVLFGNRINTVFRFHYQVWILLSVAAAYGVYYMGTVGFNLSSPWKYSLIAWRGLTILFIAGALFYPAAASFNYLNFKAKPTLDGLAFLNPAERDALAWLKANVPEGTVIAEAFGNVYSEGGRVSQRTGISTIVQWAEHQKMWRGGDEAFRGRPQDVEAIFRSNNLEQVRSLLAKYGVVLIYIGSLERQQYGDQVLTRFNNIARVVFQNQAATIYQVRSQ